MTQDQLLLLCLKVVLIAAEVSIVGFVGVYTWCAPWWKTELGRSLVEFALLVAGSVLLVIISLFFNFNRLTSHVAAWMQIGYWLLVSPVMARRALAFLKIHRERAIARAADAEAAAAPMPSGGDV